MPASSSRRPVPSMSPMKRMRSLVQVIDTRNGPRTRSCRICASESRNGVIRQNDPSTNSSQPFPSRWRANCLRPLRWRRSLVRPHKSGGSDRSGSSAGVCPQDHSRRDCMRGAELACGKSTAKKIAQGPRPLRPRTFLLRASSVNLAACGTVISHHNVGMLD